MHSITPTELRRKLFSSLRRAINGESIVIPTKDGNVVLVAERRYRPKSSSSTMAKIPGGRVSLDGADVALRAHVVIPK